MRIVKHILLFIVYGLAGIALAAVGLYVYLLQSQPDLKPWHLADLEGEFRASQAREIADLGAYRRLEERLFKEVHQEVYAKVDVKDRRWLNRFTSGSYADPESQDPNWNRTFELSVTQPRGGILMLHGLSDSPYSMRALAELLHGHGFSVVGLRLPGHGTAPVGLVHARWEDWMAATRIAARYVRSQIGPGQPFYIAGYSNGAALAVEYALAVLEGESLPAPTGLVLFSPAIGVSPAAVLAVWQARLAVIPGLEKLAWTTIHPEFDPYKYGSFAVNAGDQIYELTESIVGRLRRLQRRSGVSGFPRLLALQSAVDATVPAVALIDRLLRQLAPEGHALVLFDINRHAEAEPFLVSDPERLTQALFSHANLPFSLTLVTNISPESDEVHALHRAPHSAETREESLGVAWPSGVYSLSHVALPFPPDDPIYGERPPASPGLHLGRMELRGERGLLAFSSDQLIRLRYNPFFPYVKRRVLEFVDVSVR